MMKIAHVLEKFLISTVHDLRLRLFYRQMKKLIYEELFMNHYLFKPCIFYGATFKDLPSSFALQSILPILYLFPKIFL